MNLQHHFLIAMPSLPDPLFKRSVVYICEHNSDGAMGIVINKPVEQFTVENVLHKLKIMPADRDPAGQTGVCRLPAGGRPRLYPAYAARGFWIQHRHFAANDDNHF